MALAATIAMVVFPINAFAHVGAPGVRNILDGGAPAGVDAAIRTTAADEMVLTDRSVAALDVLAPTGEPFLRFTPNRVDVNVNSIAWFASESLSFNPVTTVPGVGPGPARWVQVADRGQWAWFDPRLRPDQPADQPAVDLPRTPLTLARWTIPLVADGRPVQLAGHRRYTPVSGSYESRLASEAPPLPGVKVAVIGGPGSNVPAVFVDNSSPATVTVLGAGGEPLLRVSPAATDANVASPSWLLTAASRAEPPAGLVSTAAPPRWVRVANQHSFSWLDERGAGRSRWDLVLTAGSARATVAVLSHFQPLHPGHGSSLGRILVGATIGALIAAVWVLWRRVRYHR